MGKLSLLSDIRASVVGRQLELGTGAGLACTGFLCRYLAHRKQWDSQ